jgi:hypothetical protein
MGLSVSCDQIKNTLATANIRMKRMQGGDGILYAKGSNQRVGSLEMASNQMM